MGQRETTMPESAIAHCGAARCACCGKVKPLGVFHHNAKALNGRQSWCKRCAGRASAEHQARPEVRARNAEYRSRPEVRERNRVKDSARYYADPAAHRARNKTYRQTLKGKLVACRCSARYRLKRATDPVKRAALLRLIAIYDAEIARLRSRTEQEDAP